MALKWKLFALLFLFLAAGCLWSLFQAFLSHLVSIWSLPYTHTVFAPIFDWIAIFHLLLLLLHSCTLIYFFLLVYSCLRRRSSTIVATQREGKGMEGKKSADHFTSYFIFVSQFGWLNSRRFSLPLLSSAAVPGECLASILVPSDLQCILACCTVLFAWATAADAASAGYHCSSAAAAAAFKFSFWPILFIYSQCVCVCCSKWDITHIKVWAVGEKLGWVSLGHPDSPFNSVLN